MDSLQWNACGDRGYNAHVKRLSFTISAELRRRLGFRAGTPMFTYIYLGTSDLERAIRFYDAAMGVLGLRRCITGDAEWDCISAGWGIYRNDGIEVLALWVGKPFDQRLAT